MTTFCQAFSTNLLFPARWPKEFVWFRYHVIQTISSYSKRNLILKQISQSKQSVKENNAPVMIGSDQECSFSCSPRAICAQKICLTKTLSEVFFCVGWMPFFRMCVLTVSGRSFTLYYECVTLNDCRVTLLLKSHNLSWYNLHSKYDILEALGQAMIWNEFFAWCRLCTWN